MIFIQCVRSKTAPDVTVALQLLCFQLPCSQTGSRRANPGLWKSSAKFHQFTDGWGTDSQLQIWILVICYLTSNCFFSLFILPLHFLCTPLPCCTSALQSPGCCSGSQSSGANNKPWKPLCPLQHTGNRVRKKDLLTIIFQPPLCKFIAQRAQHRVNTCQE